MAEDANAGDTTPATDVETIALTYVKAVEETAGHMLLLPTTTTEFHEDK